VSQSLIQRPSAWLPVVMSVLALVIVVEHLAVYGTVREPDEGGAAHFFQLLMTGQLPFVAWHVARWLPKDPGPGAKILALQILAWLAAIAPVWWFQL